MSIETPFVDASVPNFMFATISILLCELEYQMSIFPEIQEHGIVIIEDFSGIGTAHYKYMITNPSVRSVFATLLRGAMPVMVKQVWMCNQATIFTLIFKIMKPLLGKKMLERINVIGSKHQAAIEDLGGEQYAPVWMHQGQGKGTVVDSFTDDAIVSMFHKVFPFHSD